MWAGDGDRNIKLFHNMVNKRKMASRIFGIWEDGICLEKPELIQKSGLKFFEELLTGEEFVMNDDNLEKIPSLFSSEDNQFLLNLPTLEEVKGVVWEMNEDGAAGPDGFSVMFYKVCLDIIKDDVYQAVLEFFKGEAFPKGIAATTLVLIPKVDNVQQWKDFMPISLCNVSNKIVSKEIAKTEVH
ncbi:hypothetical protein ZIOFF_038095 [Zingiber officinale]|uniref:Uncharacterized protein n=1 Tax=Zingiber officinale TaxID=94328 RepID=A0A8J5GGZ9_ZINOF|nr:hypothetical protein ZIOFF_038095 [Zingiber officinale]